MAYGQGIAATPLQMISVFATIANDGRWVQPRLVRGTIDPDGSVPRTRRRQTRRVVSAETAQMVTRMLAFAVEHGTGPSAQIPGFQVAGKTGTARIPEPDRRLIVGGVHRLVHRLPAGLRPQGRRSRPSWTGRRPGTAGSPRRRCSSECAAAIARLGIAPAEARAAPAPRDPRPMTVAWRGGRTAGDKLTWPWPGLPALAPSPTSSRAPAAEVRGDRRGRRGRRYRSRGREPGQPVLLRARRGPDGHDFAGEAVARGRSPSSVDRWLTARRGPGPRCPPSERRWARCRRRSSAGR